MLIRRKNLFKAIVFLVTSAPLLWLAGLILTDELGADPVAEVMRFLGDCALWVLIAGLAVTPIWQRTGFNLVMHVRRMLGLFAAFYACLHFLFYLIFWHGLDLEEILYDMSARKHALIGLVCFILFVPLVVTSTRKMIRKLGAKRWKALHRTVYIIAIASVVHVLTIAKTGYLQALPFAIFVLVVLGFRLLPSRFEKRLPNEAEAAAVANNRHII